MAERHEFKHFSTISTRWKDNDVYGHVNNVEYYSYFDTAINAYLIQSGVLDLKQAGLIGVCAESHCKFVSGLSFPELVEVGIRVEHLGTSSVRYGIGVFRKAQATASAEGWFVHVFVNAETRRPSPMKPELRNALQTLLVQVAS